MKDRVREMLAFEDLTPEEKQKRGILGRLYGPCASISVPTRNGRGYNEALWENVFGNELTKEMFSNGGIPMELDHPTDREETDSSRIAAMMPEAPKKDDKGHLIAYCDIIDTPMGRIAYQLAKYGFKLGISSRGSGDIIQDDDGNEIVDPDTYDFTTFDLVLLPAVKDARLTMTEGLEKPTKEVIEEIGREIESGTKLDGTEYSPDERKMMTEALVHLGIVEEQESIPVPETGGDNVKAMTVESVQGAGVSHEVATDGGTEAIIQSLREALRTNSELESTVRALQEQLAVSNAKASGLEVELGKVNATLARLAPLARTSKERATKITQLEEELAKARQRSESIGRRQLAESRQEGSRLREELRKKDEAVHALEEQLGALKKESEGVQGQLQSLNSLLESERKTHADETKRLTETLNRTKKLVNDYKGAMDGLARRFIESKAKQIGVKPEEIRNRLPESYTLEDVDRVCEELRAYKVNINRLPFVLDDDSVVALRESKPAGHPMPSQSDDDYVDATTFRMAGIK